MNALEEFSACPSCRRLQFILAVCGVLLVPAVALGGAPASAGKPNVILLLADDLGFADVGYHDGEIQTPNIDRLAAAGTRLERFYVAPICSPTRAALMTGRDPMKLGIAYDQIHPWYNGGLPPGIETLPKAFRQAGYQTAIVGKWHLGHTQSHQLPAAHGFDYFHGHLQTNTDYYKHEREGAHDLQENGRPVDMTGRYLTHIQSEQAVRFLKERDAARPFLLYLAFTAPHSPMQAPDETRRLYSHLPEKDFRRTYAAMVHEMDVAIGSVLDTLEAEKLSRDTIVLFFSDNGGYYPFGANNAPLRGQKGQTFEGGIRVPAALRWPRELAAGGQVEERMTVMDVFPTLASAAGIAIPEAPGIDGVDMWPVIRAGAPAPERGAVFFASEIPIPGLIHLAVLDGDWKLVQIVREGQTETRVRDLLFRIDEDPNEERDLSLEHPEVVARLAGQIRAWRSQHPMAGFRGTLVAHPGWVAPYDWAEAVTPGRLLQPEWRNELPFPQALLDATRERGVLVDDAARSRLETEERVRDAAWGSSQP